MASLTTIIDAHRAKMLRYAGVSAITVPLTQVLLFVFNTGENLMRPWLVGETIEMPTFVVFISSTIGVLIAGAFGAIVAIPLVAVAGEVKRIYLTDEPPQEPASP